jgi:hypothetical protein
MGVPLRVPQDRGQVLDLLRGHQVLSQIRPPVELGEGHVELIREVPLPQPMGSHHPPRGAPARRGERQTVRRAGQAALMKQARDVRGASDRHAEVPGEGLHGGGAAPLFRGMQMFQGVFQADAQAECVPPTRSP